MKLNLTVAKVHRLNRALTAISKGFPNGEGKPASVLKSASAKLRVARAMRKLHEVLEPAEETMMKERERLFEEQQAENADAKELSPARAVALNRFVSDLNNQPVELELDPVDYTEVDVDRFDGEEAMQSLAVLDGIFLVEPQRAG